MKFKKKLLIYLARKESSYFWYFIDNLACKLDKIAEIYGKKSIGDEYKKEYDTIGISKSDKVLHVGCGSFPLTEITLVETTNANIVGIDKNLEAVKSAKDIVHRKNLNDKIKIDHGDGINYPVEKFDVVILSSCASPKEKIIQRIFKEVKNDCKIIIREIDTAVEPVHKNIDLHEDIILMEKIRHHPFLFPKPFGWQSFYLVKK